MARRARPMADSTGRIAEARAACPCPERTHTLVRDRKCCWRERAWSSVEAGSHSTGSVVRFASDDGMNANMHGEGRVGYATTA